MRDIIVLVASELTRETIRAMAEFATLHYVNTDSSVVIAKDVIKERIEFLDPDVLIVDATTIDEYVIGKAKRLNLIHCTRGNPVNIDLDYCKKKGIAVGRSPGRNANAVAEFTFGLMINITRKISLSNSRLKRGDFLISDNWEKKREEPVEDVIWNSPEFTTMPYQEYRSPELATKKLGLVGFGAIGHMIAEKAQAFDMNVIAYDPYVKSLDLPYVKLVSIEDLAKTADIVSIHAKETPETVNMINKDFFSKMKRGSYLINTSRGKLVDRFALLEAVKTKKISGAALDVFDYEPLCKDDPLLACDEILITPHIGGASSDVIKHHSKSTLINFFAYIDGEKITTPCF